jgi:hypothetical protein
LKLFNPARGEHNTATFLCEQARRILSKPRGRARDQNNLFLQ